MTCSSRYHQSDYSPDEEDHITVHVASKKSWEAEDKYARKFFHIYKKSASNGDEFNEWRTQQDKKNKFRSDTIKEQLKEAESVDLFKTLPPRPAIPDEEWNWIHLDFILDAPEGLEEYLTDPTHGYGARQKKLLEGEGGSGSEL